MFPIINVFKCDGCGVCVLRCPPKIMGMIGGKAAYLQMLCEECGICAESCPNGSILFELPEFSGGSETHREYEYSR